MTYQTIGADICDGVMTVTLNRPDRLNAFNRQMVAEVVDALDEADRNDAVRAVIFTGAGRAFSSGADLSAGSKTFDYEKRSDEPDYSDTPVRGDGTVDYSHP